MSTIKNTNNNSKKNNSPFCKVCFDAGKSEKEYRSHFVKNEVGGNSIVVCPTIKSIECRYCHKAGHTVKYCDALKDKSKVSKVKKIGNKNNNNDNEIGKNRSPVISKESSMVSKGGYFMALDESDDEEYPQISNKKEQSTILTGWAAVVSKAPPKPVLRRELYLTSTLNTEVLPNEVVAASAAAVQTYTETDVDIMPAEEYVLPLPKKKPIMNWADYESDTDDDN